MLRNRLGVISTAVAAAMALTAVTAIPADARSRGHGGNAAALAAIAGIFGTIATIAAADAYRDRHRHYYGQGPYYGGPYAPPPPYAYGYPPYGYYR